MTRSQRASIQCKRTPHLRGGFGTAFTSWWQKLFAGLWALAIIAAGAALLIAIVAMRKATNNNIPGQADEAKSHAVWAGAALAGLAGLGVILGAIITVAS